MIKTIARLSITIGFITVCACWIAHGLGLLPDSRAAKIQSRVRFGESVAISVSSLAELGNLKQFEPFLQQSVGRHPELKSARITTSRGKQIALIGKPVVENITSQRSTPDRMLIDIFADGKPWGRLELYFEPMPTGIWTYLQYPMSLIAFIGASVGLLCWFYLSRTLRYLNPSKVVPDRVKSALDTLTEGLILMDPSEQIVLANEAFGKIVGREPGDLIGFNPSIFEWKQESESADAERMPWSDCLEGGHVRTSGMLSLDQEENTRKFIVNSAPILGDQGNCKGILVSFDDVTDLDNKRTELTKMIDILRTSRDEIRRQNEQLQYLASRDSLTGCLNRRAFFEQFNMIWDHSEVTSIAVMMLDIDYFKSINDNYGHSVGDDVIRGVAHQLHESVGERGVVCRFGGEEFVVALANVDFDSVSALAESIRSDIAADEYGGVTTSCSVGISARGFGAMDPQHLLDQADQCLYAAKEQGRNQVVRWDKIPNANLPQSQAAGAMSAIPVQHYSVVSALFSALYFRDKETALHSARVANLSVGVAQQILEEDHAKLIETAALLHDIGKIGVPERILWKPSRLSLDEWKIMRQRDRISAQILDAALGSSDLTSIVANYNIRYDEALDSDSEHCNSHIVKCRSIIAVCDAFDAMVNKPAHGESLTAERAFVELQECSGMQFDPQAVEALIACVSANPTLMDPLSVDGVDFDRADLERNMSRRIAAAVTSGDMGEIRMLMRQLDPDRNDDRQEMYGMLRQLQKNIGENDDNLDQIVELTEELLGIIQDSPSKAIHLPEQSLQNN